MTTHEFDLSTVGSIDIEATTGEEAITKLQEEIRSQIEQGLIPANEVKTYDVAAMCTGCKYRVAGTTPNDAKDSLRTHIEREANGLKENIQHGERGHEIAMDINTSCETIREVDGNYDINRQGEREY